MRDSVGTVPVSGIMYDILYKIHDDIVNKKSSGSYRHYYFEIYDYKKEELVTRLGQPQIEIGSIEEFDLNRESFYDKEVENLFEAKDGLLYSYPKELNELSDSQIMYKLFEMDKEKIKRSLEILDIKIDDISFKETVTTTVCKVERITGPMNFDISFGKNTEKMILNSLSESFELKKGYMALETKFLDLISSQYEKLENSNLEYFEVREIDGLTAEALKTGLLYLYYLGKIDIKDINASSIKILGVNDYKNHTLKMNDEFYDEIKRLVNDVNVENIAIEKDEAGIPTFLKAKYSIYGDDEKFTDLLRKYPYSDITSRIHGKKVGRYIVELKTKLEP